MAVDPTHVSFVQRNAVAIKKIENLDCNFSAVIEAIAELSRREYASRRIAATLAAIDTISLTV